MRAEALSVPEIDAVARDMLAGVAAAHAKGWVHRDLKPANVLLQRDGDRLTARITDFGLAGVVDAASGTFTRQGAGTRRYMSQEQLAGIGRPADGRVRARRRAVGDDEGQPAFADQDVWRRAVASGEGPPMSRDVPQRFTVAVSAALSGDRPADAAALRDLWTGDEAEEPSGFRRSTLSAALAAQPVPQAVMTDPTMVATTAPRQRRGWGGIALGVLGLGVAAALSLWEEPPPEPVDASPPVHADPAIQRRFTLAWEQFATPASRSPNKRSVR